MASKAKQPVQLPREERGELLAALSAELVARWRNGDQEAAREIFERYLDRLTALARVRLSAKLAARLDADDIVMSAYRSFFVGARDGRFTLDRAGDLWRLLVQITLLLTRQPPIAGRRTSEILAWVVSGLHVAPPRSIRHDIPEDLSQICMRCLASRPVDRFTSATEVIQALEAFSNQ